MDTTLPRKIHGMTPDEFEMLVDRCRTFLIGVAAERRTTTYKDVMAFLGVDRFKIPYILGAVSEREKAEGRPALSSLVFYVDKPEAGSGFTDLAKDVGWLPEGASDEGAYVFWLKELHSSWVRWG